MRHEPRGFQAVPPSFLIAICISLTYGNAGLAMLPSEMRYAATLPLLSKLMFAYGAFALAGRRTGAARIGLIVAAVGSLAILAYGYVVNVTFEPRTEASTIALYVCDVLTEALTLGGLVIASRHRHLAAKITAAAVMLTLYEVAPVMFVWRMVHTVSSGDNMFYQRILAGLGLIRTGLLTWLILSASGPGDARDPRRARRGLGRAAVGMRLGLVCAGVGLIRAFAFEGRDEQALRLPVQTAIAIACIAAFAWCGLGLLDVGRAAIGELGRYVWTIAGALAMWAAVVVFSQAISPLIAPAVQRRTHVAGLSNIRSLAVIILVQLSLIMVAAAIRRFATRRQLYELRSHATARMAWTATMLVVSSMCWVLFSGRFGSLGSNWAMFAVACALSTLELTARLCRVVAREIRSEDLPTARIVSAV